MLDSKAIFKRSVILGCECWLQNDLVTSRLSRFIVTQGDLSQLLLFIIYNAHLSSLYMISLASQSEHTLVSFSSSIVIIFTIVDRFIGISITLHRQLNVACSIDNSVAPTRATHGAGAVVILSNQLGLGLRRRRHRQ